MSASLAADNLGGIYFVSLHAIARGIPAEMKDAQQEQTTSNPAVCLFAACSVFRLIAACREAFCCFATNEPYGATSRMNM
jgi:hypothetical protein